MPEPPDPHPAVSYRQGLAVLRHVREGQAPEWMRFDPRLGAYTAPGHRLPELRDWVAERWGGDVLGEPDNEHTPFFDPRRPRDYQREALARWLAGNGRGSVVLPTGAGKSFVAVLAIHETGGGACVVVPTKSLIHQWFAQLAEAFGSERVGAFYGDEKEVQPITVTTYHSAFGLLERWGDRFDLLVLDEIHHLSDNAEGAPKSWHDALTIAPAPRRLGLTATYPDGQDRALTRLVGPVAYRRTIGEMADRELARFAVERRFVPLTEGERRRYDALTARYDAFVAKRRYSERYDKPDDTWRVFMAETRTSPPARRAFRAFLDREALVATAENKLREVGRILRLFPAEQAVIFAGRREAAFRISRELAIPILDADTPASERKRILDAIAGCDLHAVVSVKVLDEGWDVPGAKLGVVVGDSTRGGTRQHAQRLGRILRRQGDAVASMYEIVAAGTYEFLASQRRGTVVRQASDAQLGLGV